MQSNPPKFVPTASTPGFGKKAGGYSIYQGKYYPIEYLGTVGMYDQYPIHEFKWLAGPKKGKIERTYSASWYRKTEPVFRIEYQESWGEWFPIKTVAESKVKQALTIAKKKFGTVRASLLYEGE